LDAAASALDGVDGGSVGGETRRPDGGETDFVLGDFPDAVRTGSNDTDIVVFQQPGCGPGAALRQAIRRTLIACSWQKAREGRLLRVVVRR
jgi:hypothetical protein